MTLLGERRIKNYWTYIIWLFNIVLTIGIIYGTVIQKINSLQVNAESRDQEHNKMRNEIKDICNDVIGTKTDIKWIKEGIERIERKIDKK